MRILVASVYNEESLKWFEIQSEFIKRNTSSEFNHVVFFHGVMDGFFGLRCESQDAREQHVFGIEKILEEFRNNATYTHCLILDSDAFPVEKGWDIKIQAIMEGKSCSSACPIRFENLDTFFHPCVIFFNRDALSLSVGIKESKNLIYYEFEEVVVSPPGRTFPLLRTNVLSPHPVAASIYYDMFYHHGFGSRDFQCRSVHVNDYYLNCPGLDSLNKQFFSNPRSFVGKLRGRKTT